MNILIGFLIGVVCLGVPMILQYRAYRNSIRAVSDKWKGINDEWAARYHNLYDSWMSGVKPTAEQRQQWEFNQFSKQANEMIYSPTDERGYSLYSGLARVIDSATKDKSKGVKVIETTT